MNLNFFFLKHCKSNEYEINENQIDIINNLKHYYTDNFNQSLLNKIFKKNNNKLRILSCWRCWGWKNNDFKFFFQ